MFGVTTYMERCATHICFLVRAAYYQSPRSLLFACLLARLRMCGERVPLWVCTFQQPAIQLGIAISMQMGPCGLSDKLLWGMVLFVGKNACNMHQEPVSSLSGSSDHHGNLRTSSLHKSCCMQSSHHPPIPQVSTEQGQANQDPKKHVLSEEIAI